jgi:hypothetical protein
MQKITMYWRDIPSMVMFRKGREKGKVMMPDRFQEAIDRAAMRAGKGGSDLYLEEWRRVNSDVDSSEFPEGASLLEIATTEADGISASIDDDLLKRMVKNNGHSVEDQ